MADAADPLVLDFVEWIAREPRLYSEVIATWRTSCPRLTIWEDAVDGGYVARESVAGFGVIITVTEDGEKLLPTAALADRMAARTCAARPPPPRNIPRCFRHVLRINSPGCETPAIDFAFMMR